MSPAKPDQAWLTMIASLFVTTVKSSALMFRTSLPSISGLDVMHHSEK
jgi:hypothetical protein